MFYAVGFLKKKKVRGLFVFSVGADRWLLAGHSTEQQQTDENFRFVGV